MSCKFVLDAGKVGSVQVQDGPTHTGKDIPVHITGIYVTYLHSPRSGGLHIAYVGVTYVTDT